MRLKWNNQLSCDTRHQEETMRGGENLWVVSASAAAGIPPHLPLVTGQATVVTGSDFWWAGNSRFLPWPAGYLLEKSMLGFIIPCQSLMKKSRTMNPSWMMSTTTRHSMGASYREWLPLWNWFLPPPPPRSKSSIDATWFYRREVTTITHLTPLHRRKLDTELNFVSLISL